MVPIQILLKLASDSGVMPVLRFVTLDVFTSERYAGNPLAIVHIPAGIAISSPDKLKIAAEFNFSETGKIRVHCINSNILVLILVGQSLSMIRNLISETRSELAFIPQLESSHLQGTLPLVQAIISSLRLTLSASLLTRRINIQPS